MDDLLTHWRNVIDDEAAGRHLLARWSEPHRRYHGVEHLRAVLTAIDELADRAADADAVRLAAWFHDAVYSGRPGDDERASADLAASMLPRLGIDAERRSEIVRLVELTAGHDPAPNDTNGAVLCDADLAILGAGPEEYAAYAAAVREEYAWVPDGDFQRGRIDVLERLAARDSLFTIDTARMRWEQTARRNIETELTLLRAGASAS